MPGTQPTNDQPQNRDKADALAEEYENAHHDRAGHDKPTPSHQAKPHSVRQGGK